MNEDHPLWYDEAEPDEGPGPLLTLLAAAFATCAEAVALAWRIVWLPDRIWLGSCALIGRFAQRVRPARR